ncbi:MAG: ribonuclease E/G [Rubellimicrobium sp.]|nr:ribonuclease E/G [Rubellimicrobium sp.]
MKGRVIVLGDWNGRQAAALVQDGRLDDLLIDDDGAPRPGAIFRATCERVLKGQGGAFLRLPGGETAWLRAARGMKPGETALVQVTGVAEPGKAVPVTDRVLFKGRYAIITPGAPGVNVSRKIRDDALRAHLLALAGTPPEGTGAILRSSCEGADDAAITDDLAAMAALAAQVLGDTGTAPELLADGDGPHDHALREWSADQVVTEQGAFDHMGIAGQIAALASPLVDLGGGAGMAVEVTRALVAVDVNTGGDSSPAAALKANLAAARALPRQLRLRGLGGQVVVDFVGMSKAQRQPLDQSLQSVFRADPVETSLVGWTAMGLYELNRKRERVPLARLVAEGA